MVRPLLTLAGATAPILVTGGAGYVGSHAVLELAATGAQVVIADDFSTGHRALVPPGVEAVTLDVRDAAAVKGLFSERRFGAVLHFAARSLVPESMTDPYGYIADNLGGALSLIRAAAGSGVTKFVLSSTANLFDTGSGTALDESAPVVPGSPYGESKFLIERVLHWADRISGLRYAALRYFNAAGADPKGRAGEEHSPETHLIPIVLEAALGQRPHVTIFGDDYPTPDGTAIRDYVHVSDLARAHVAALTAIDSGSLAANLGTGRGYSVREIIAAAEQVTGKRIPVVVGPRRAGDPAVLVANASLAERRLGFRPEHDLFSIIETAWRWRLAHPNGFGA